MTGGLYLVTPLDNVATALCALPAGSARLSGAKKCELELLQPLQAGHKAAVRPIAAGGEIVKYGAVIGLAARDISPGEWVHLHNLRSRWDERSSQIDPKTGKVMDTSYE